MGLKNISFFRFWVLFSQSIRQALHFVADDPQALVGIAIVGVEVGAGVKGGLGSHALDVIVGEIGGHRPFA
jgi:hypothetical protein